MAVSLRREEKEGSGGGTLHSYRVIVRTTQVGQGQGSDRGFHPQQRMYSESPYMSSSAPDPPWHHLGGGTASRAPKGPVPEEASGARGSQAEPDLPAPGLSLTEGATHTAHAGRASGKWSGNPQPSRQTWSEPSRPSSHTQP